MGRRTNFNDLKDRDYGRLHVEAETDQRQGGHVVWRCVCACGAVVLTAGCNLTSGNTLSCGCWQEEVSSRPAGERREYADTTPPA